MSRKKIKVLYIAGSGRSGSTLLERVIGQIEGFFPVGELKYVWERGLAENQLCGCGTPFRECSFWKAVMEEAYGGLDQVSSEEMIRLRRQVDRVRFVPQIISPWRTPRYQERFKEYSRRLEQLYAAIQKVSGSRVIIDSSKDPSPAYVLGTLSMIDLYVVHLVRDCRAVAYSWMRKKIRPEIQDKVVYIPQFGPLESSWGWVFVNMCIEPLKYLNSRYTFLRYEDFVANPKAGLSRILTLVQEDVRDLPLIGERSVYLESHHTVSGNPLRFKQGLIEIRADDEWRMKMRDRHRYLVNVLSWPLLMKYGYFGRKRGKINR